MYAYNVNTKGTTFFMNWIPRIEGNKPIYLELADDIGRAIISGKLTPGERLPTQREMAQKLGIDLTTVTRAYAQAQRLDFIISEGRRGSFVNPHYKPSHTPLDLGKSDKFGFAGKAELNELAAVESAGRNFPPEPEGDILRMAINEGIASIVKRHGQLPLCTHPPGGAAWCRANIASIFDRFMTTSPEQVVITSGAQSAIHIICASLLQPGDTVACGKYTYPGFLTAARQRGANVIPVDMDENGLIAESLEEVVRSKKIKLLYLVPYNDNPTTATLSPQRRREIAQCAEKYDFQVLEDDAYGGLIGFNPENPLSVSTLIPSRCWYVVSMSKSFTPAFRVAHIRAPNVSAAFELIACLQDIPLTAAPMDIAIDQQWLQDGTLMQLGAAVAREAAARQQIARKILGDVFCAQPESYHIWLQRPDRDDIFPNQSPMLFGLPVVSGAMFAVNPSGKEQSLRVSLGGPRSREQVASDLSRLQTWLQRNNPA